MGVLFSIHSEFRYDIVRKIYEGGMGIVYEAEQHGARDFVKRVAIKVIRQSYANQKQFIDNFIGEAKLVADLIHTNIVQTYHLGETRGIYFISMELIRGVNLEQFAQQLTDKRRVLPSELAVFIVSRVARGLAYAHAKTDKDANPEESRQRMMNLPIPDFRALDQRIDERLNEILHRALARELDKRYPNADELLYDLEHYIYHSGYGPTNETLGRFMRELFGQMATPAPVKGATEVLERTDRIYVGT